jgi:hypothetical protein
VTGVRRGVVRAMTGGPGERAHENGQTAPMVRRGWWWLPFALLLLGGWAGPSATSLPSAVPLTVAISLAQNRSTAGATIRGTAVVTNNSHRSIKAFGCGQPWLEVGLSSRSIPFRVTNNLVGCTHALLLTPGRHRVPLEIATTYQGCSEDGGGTPTSPPCDGSAGNRIPPLPPGRYTTKTIADVAGVPPSVRETSVSLLRKR